MSESVANRTKIYRINQNAKPQKVPKIWTARSSYIIEVSVVKRMNSLSLIFPSFAQSPNFILQDTPSLSLSSSLPITPSQLSYLAPKPNFCSYHSSYSHSSDLNRNNTHPPAIFPYLSPHPHSVFSYTHLNTAGRRQDKHPVLVKPPSLAQTTHS